MILFDTETTGLPVPNEPDLSKQPRIVEIAAIKVNDKLEEIARFTTLVNPQQPLPPEASKWYDITDADLVRAPTFPVALKQFILPFWLGETTVVAYNVGFDLQMLRMELQRIAWEDRFPYCWDVVDAIQYRGLRRIRLNDWSKECLGPDWVPQTHRALGDTELLLACYRTLKN